VPLADSFARGARALLSDFTRDRPPWRARTVRWAASLAMLGVALAAWRALGGGEAPGLDARAWPLPLRVGLSYIGGFGVGWCLRRFLKLTLLGLLGAALLFFLLRLIGLEGGPWQSLQEGVSGGLSGAREEASAIGRVVRGSLPSAGSATLGAFLGYLYRVRDPEPEPEPDA